MIEYINQIVTQRKTFFPTHWSMSQKALKIHEALQNSAAMKSEDLIIIRNGEKVVIGVKAYCYTNCGVEILLKVSTKTNAVLQMYPTEGLINK